MTSRRQIKLLAAITALRLFLVLPASAFSLIGPYADWMTPNLAYRLPGDIGGPMDIQEEYRWNVPIVTYAFDPSFTDFFGTNGVAAVESAIAMLNALPPASAISLTNYPLESTRLNPVAQQNGLYDLKTVTLAYLLEQMGLTAPSRYLFTMRRADTNLIQNWGERMWPPGTIPNSILERNFDPDELAASTNINGVRYTGIVLSWPDGQPQWDIMMFPIDPLAFFPSTTADLQYNLSQGDYVTSLSRDDVGGLRYLLHTNNVNLELALPDVHPAPFYSSVWPSLARRPGVDKLTFTRHQLDLNTGRPQEMTFHYHDAYYSGNRLKRVPVTRVVTQPDITFSSSSGSASFLTRTGTSNWWNSARATGDTNHLGPGVIRPPIKITFGHLYNLVISQTGYSMYPPLTNQWASIDGSTNYPITYPQGTNAAQARSLDISLFLYRSNPFGMAGQYKWHTPVPLGHPVTLQTSADLSNWTESVTVINNGTEILWNHYMNSDPSQFFRVIPQ